MDRQANQNYYPFQATVSGTIHDMVTLTRLAGLTAGEKRIFWVIKRMKSLSEKWFTHIFLIGCLLLYSVLGAVIFMGLEGPHEKWEIKEAEEKFLEYIKLKKDFIKQVQLTCENTSTNSSIIFAEHFEENLNIYENNVKNYKRTRKPKSYKKTWRFWNSMLYAATIYSTIGYGHITPKTMSGRIVTIIYSIIGIPFFLIVLADLGKLLTKGLKLAWANMRIICCKIRKQLDTKIKMFSFLFKTSVVETENDANEGHQRERNPGDDPSEPTPDAHIDLETEENCTNTDPCHIPDEEINDTFDLPVSVALTLLLTYLFLGGAIFTFMEHWSYCDSFYFTFISMSTIGLGDLVPSKPKYMIAFMFYLTCGLALMSMCITVVQNQLFVTFNKAQKKAAESLGMKVNSVRK